MLIFKTKPQIDFYSKRFFNIFNVNREPRLTFNRHLHISQHVPGIQQQLTVDSSTAQTDTYTNHTTGSTHGIFKALNHHGGKYCICVEITTSPVPGTYEVTIDSVTEWTITYCRIRGSGTRDFVANSSGKIFYFHFIFYRPVGRWTIYDLSIIKPIAPLIKYSFRPSPYEPPTTTRFKTFQI